jgi:hypothetical protein
MLKYDIFCGFRNALLFKKEEFNDLQQRIFLQGMFKTIILNI